MITDIEKISNLIGDGYLKMHRINFKGMRLYIQDNPFQYYSGLTGALKASTFQNNIESKMLKRWREDQIESFGKKQVTDYVKLTADFGSLLHSSLITMHNNGKINWNEEAEKARDYFMESYKEKEIIPDKRIVRKMVYEYQKHVASLMQFIYERVEKIYAVETPAKWENLRIATPIDLYCLCRPTPKGKPVKMVINIKTSSSISKGHLDQVACELDMWNETYGDAEACGIMRTTDWREEKTPSYNFKYISAENAFDMALAAKARLALCLDSDDTYLYEVVDKVFDGITPIGEKPVIITRTLQEEWEMVNDI